MLVESPHPRRPGWLAGTACRYAPVHVPMADLAAGGITIDGKPAGQSMTGRAAGVPLAGRLVDLVVERATADHLEASFG